MSFTTHPYKRPTIGNIEELDASSLDEVKQFHATFYRPDNAVLVVAGDFEPADLQKWVDQYFGPIPKPETPVPRVTAMEPPRTGERTLRDSSPKIPLPALAVTYLGPAITSEEAPALQVLQQALSGGASSRLYRVLVYEKELAQTAQFAADLRTDLGLLTFQLILASGVDVAKARAALLEEVKKIAEAPISAAELTTAKNQLLASQLAERETCDGKASALAEAAAIHGDPGRVNSDLAKLEAVTAEQVQAAAKKWFTDDNRLVLEYLPVSATPKGKEKK